MVVLWWGEVPDLHVSRGGDWDKGAASARERLGPSGNARMILRYFLAFGDSQSRTPSEMRRMDKPNAAIQTPGISAPHQ